MGYGSLFIILLTGGFTGAVFCLQTVKALSRFQTDKEAAEVREGVRTGAVDVVIGGPDPIGGP